MTTVLDLSRQSLTFCYIVRLNGFICISLIDITSSVIGVLVAVVLSIVLVVTVIIVLLK